jgi:phage replication-related protein YjqB (UPF0714/DUF867 family)
MLYQSASQSPGCLFIIAFGMMACTEKTLAMPDKYRSFSHLQAVESADSYKIKSVARESAIAIIAPHAGKIEPGTSEICRAIAGHDRSYYVFEGCKPKGFQRPNRRAWW